MRIGDGGHDLQPLRIEVVVRQSTALNFEVVWFAFGGFQLLRPCVSDFKLDSLGEPGSIARRKPYEINAWLSEYT